MKNLSSFGNIISRLTFAWVLKLFLRDYKKEKSKFNFFQLPEKQKSYYLFKKIQDSWNTEVTKRKSKTNPSVSLVQVIMNIFGVDILFIGFIQLLCESFTRGLQPLMMVKFLRYFGENSTTSKSEACYWTLGIIICLLIQIHFFHHLFNATTLLGVKIKVAYCTLIYKKVLTMSTISLSKSTAAGEIVNLLTNDATTIESSLMFLHYIWLAPLQGILVAYIIYANVGVVPLSGVLVFFLFIPIQGIICKIIPRLSSKAALQTDDRLGLINQTIGCIQVIKMFVWEKLFIDFVNGIRKNEAKQLFKLNVLRLMSVSSIFYISRVAIIITLIFYVTFQRSMRVETFFLLIIYYMELQLLLNYYFPMGLQQMTTGLASVRRIEQFMNLDDIEKKIIIPTNTTEIGTVTLENITANWNPETIENTLRNINFSAKSSSFTAIVGQVGSGKSSLLQVILQEWPIIEGEIKIFGRIAYVGQDPWIFSATIRQNIIFNRPLDQDFYDKVVRVCQLEEDFSCFPYRDHTEIGENGINLSGGQRTRLALARAVYSNADIYLLDDPFSAIDAKVGRHIFNECLCGFLQNKTRILITHHLQYLEDVDNIYLLNDGKITTKGTFKKLQSSLKEFVFKNSDDSSSTNEVQIPMKEKNFKFQKSKESDTEIEKNSPNTYLALLQAVGNWWLIVICFFLFSLSQIAMSAGDFYIIYWTINDKTCFDNFAKGNASDHVTYSRICPKSKHWSHIYTFGGLMTLAIIGVYLKVIFFGKIWKNASNHLHFSMFESVVQGGMSFFYKNTSGHILSRFSKDIGVVDRDLPRTTHDFLLVSFVVMSLITLTILVNYWLVLPMILSGICFYFLTKLYLKTASTLKQLDGIKQSSVLKTLTDTLKGLATIRSFGAEEHLTEEFHQRQDEQTTISTLFMHTSRGFRYFIDIVLAIYLAIVCFTFILTKNFMSINDVGLILSQSFAIIAATRWGLFQATEMDSQMSSVKRILEFNDIEQETSLEIVTEEEHCPEGGIQFKNVFFRYCFYDLPVLKNISFKINSGEKIGVVGRTGAGKSSLVGALLRLGFIEGKILIDGVMISMMSLQRLRSMISVIPQQSCLFSGTLRRNLDPFGEFSDEDIIKALNTVGLKITVDGLETIVAAGGVNFSTGQRQLICLARAFIRRNKILVLDEATANLDPDTDDLVQNAINRLRDCTIFIIAHRLNTIMNCDRIIVLNEGQLVEFDHPLVLLEKKNGPFFDMIKNYVSVSSDTQMK